MRRLALAMTLLVPGAASAASCDGTACGFATLKPFLAKLAAARPTPGKRPVHIIQIGDSHTAGDVLTGAWRDILQARYGNGGRGVLAPGRPWDGYVTRGVTASMSPGWLVSATFGKGSAEPHPAPGLSSYLLRSTQPGAWIGLATDSPDMAFDRVVLCGSALPLKASVTVRAGITAQTIDMEADAAVSRCATMRTATPQLAISMKTTGGPVMLSSIATFRDNGGVALSNLGVVGAQLQHFARTDDDLLGYELTAYAPDLIVLAFGTNEGFSPRLDPAAYEAGLRGQIARLRKLSPGTPILLLGAPDALSRNAALRTNADGAAIDCPDSGSAPLFAPPALAVVRGIQRKVASDLKLAFWDWQAAMGGACSARTWTDATPPLMRPDHVHFLRAGGQILAQRLQADLDRAMKD